jgi:hypothetical protein
VTFREWLVRQHQLAVLCGHRRWADRFRIALDHLDGGSIARALTTVPTHFRSAARAFAVAAMQARATRRQRGRAA